MGLVSGSYFDKIVREMVAKEGFSFISRVSIGDRDYKYHVPVTMARDTRLVFHERGEAIILLLAYNENDFYERTKVQSHWRITLCRQHCSLVDLPIEEHEKFVRSGGVLFENPAAPEGFHYLTVWGGGQEQVWSTEYEQLKPFDAPLPAEKVVEAAADLREAVIRWVASGCFTELQVTSFPPYYTFPGCEQLFWRRFDTKYFRTVVRKPYGSP